MIVVRLCGGLGNQLFQYAAGRALAHARNTELVLDLAWYEDRPAVDTPRAYELTHYAIQARPADASEALWCRLHHGRLLHRLRFLPRRWRHFRERGFAFDPRVLALPDDSYLYGYWQSPLYFEAIADLLRAELVPSVPLGGRDEEMAAMIAQGDAIAIHVRRGDYVAHQAAATTHGLCSLDYYKAAAAQLLAHVRQPHFFVFSDDVAWTRTHLQLPGQVTYVDHNGPDAAFQDLRLMALCQHQIVANSSFSWWGAWLNPHPGKVVVAPARWFADGRDTRTLTPPDWVRL